MAYIESAYYGDQKSQRNATQVLADKILGTTLEVDVAEGLIPPLTTTDKVELTSLEEKRIREAAAAFCGGVDQDCIRRKEGELRQNALDAKQQQANSTANAIQGRRLTVNIIDENGQRRRIVVPDGQKFKLENVSVNDPRKGPLQVPSLEYFQNQFKLLGSLILSTLAYVFGVAATYSVFFPVLDWFAIPLVVISVFIPYSGYIMIFLWFMFNAAVKTYTGDML